MSDSEEGEIASSSPDMNFINPEWADPSRSKLGQDPARSSLPPLAALQVSSYRSSFTPANSSSDDNSDKEDKNVSLWKKKKQAYIRKQMDISMPSGPEMQKSLHLHGLSQVKKTNNVWGSVLEEQDLTQTLSRSAAVDRPEDVNFNERTVESYDFTRKYKDPRADFDDLDVPDVGKPKEVFESVVTSSNVPSRIRAIVDYDDTLEENRKQNQKQERSREQTQQHHRRKRKAENSVEREMTSGVFDRLGAKRVTTTNLGEIDVNADMDNETVVKKIVEFLNEPKVVIIERIVEHLGKEVAIRLVHATQDVEENGGMYINDGSRRRTPGGVYLQLMKEQSEFNSKKKKLIFKEEHEQMVKEKKEKRKRWRKRDHNTAIVQKQDKDSRSRSNSRSRSSGGKGGNHVERMDDGEVVKSRGENVQTDNRKSRRGRRNKLDCNSYSDDSEEDSYGRSSHSKSKAFNFEEELAAAKKLILEKSKSVPSMDTEDMGGEVNNTGQDKENVAEMSDLDIEEANVVDVQLE